MGLALPWKAMNLFHAAGERGTRWNLPSSFAGGPNPAAWMP